MKIVSSKLLPYVPTALAGGLLVFTLGYHIAQANVVSDTVAPAAKTSPAQSQAPSSSVPKLTQAELQQILRKPVFGQIARIKPQAKKIPTVKQPAELPKTRLQLSLNGVVAKDDHTKGHAIIDNKEYRVGETVVQGAKLHAVYSDRVVLEHRNKLEVLSLPDTDTSNSNRLGNNRNQFGRNDLARRAKKNKPE